MRHTRSAAILAMLIHGAAGAQGPAPDPSVAQKAPDLAPVPFGGIYLGGGGGASPDGAAPTMMGSLVIDRQLFWRLGVWLSGEWAYLWRKVENEFALRLCAGLRIDVWRSESNKVRVIANLSFAHQHQSTVSGWEAHPVDNALGESKHGLGHRTGIEMGGGLVLTPWIDSRNPFARRLRALVRVSAQLLPDDRGTQWLVAGITSIGVAL